MISNEQILMQIEKQLRHAKTKDSEQSIREALAAIRALCDVALDTATFQPPVEMATISRVQQQPILTQTKTLQEDDANGESLFDF